MLAQLRLQIAAAVPVQALALTCNDSIAERSIGYDTTDGLGNEFEVLLLEHHTGAVERFRYGGRAMRDHGQVMHHRFE